MYKVFGFIKLINSFTPAINLNDCRWRHYMVIYDTSSAGITVVYNWMELLNTKYFTAIDGN